MKLHPALKVAKRILKKAGIETFYSGSLSLQVLGSSFDRPMHVDLILSSCEDKGKMVIGWFYDIHPLFEKVNAFNGYIFDFR